MTPVRAKRTIPVRAKRTIPVPAKRTIPVRARRTIPVRAGRTTHVRAAPAISRQDRMTGGRVGGGRIGQPAPRTPARALEAVSRRDRPIASVVARLRRVGAAIVRSGKRRRPAIAPTRRSRLRSGRARRLRPASGLPVVLLVRVLAVAVEVAAALGAGASGANIDERLDDSGERRR